MPESILIKFIIIFGGFILCCILLILIIRSILELVLYFSYKNYQKILAAGVAREVARAVLPVTLYSSMYVTMNARALMNFLSLRTAREGSHFPSYPQREIEMVAEKMEAEFAKLMPITYGAFQKSGRIAP